MREEILYASTDAAHVSAPPTIEELASRPLILADASYGAEDPMRRQLAELAQRVGVSIQPQIDVEDIEAALELASRGLGDTIVSRGILLAMGRRVSKRLGWVPFDEPFYTTFAFVSRANAPLSPASREFLGLAREGLDLKLALSAVVEDDSGRLAYWALKHAPGKPDFHHPDGFVLELTL